MVFRLRRALAWLSTLRRLRRWCDAGRRFRQNAFKWHPDLHTGDGKKLAEEGTANANRGAVLAVALTPRRLVACLQRNLDVRVPMPRERVSSFGETTAALEGQRARACMHSSQSRTTTRRGCYHELQQLRVTRFWIHDINDQAASALHRFALVRRGGYEHKLFSLTYSLIPYSASRRPLPLDVRPLASARVRLCPPAFVGFGFRREQFPPRAAAAA